MESKSAKKKNAALAREWPLGDGTVSHLPKAMQKLIFKVYLESALLWSCK